MVSPYTEFVTTLKPWHMLISAVTGQSIRKERVEHIDLEFVPFHAYSITFA